MLRAVGGNQEAARLSGIKVEIVRLLGFVIVGLGAALAGIIWMLFATHTTLSVPALTGAIMCMGVATANIVLVISFAREKLNELGDATQAALEAGFVRLRRDRN